MKKQRKSLIYVRLFRPLIHFIFIICAFYLAYNLRFHTDLIPFVQLRIPNIDVFEISLFAVISGLIFILIGFFNGIYELFKPIHGYYRKYLKSWFVWIIVMSFVAFFGSGFLFKLGISRFVIVWAGVFFWILGSIIDSLLNYLNSRHEKAHPYKILFLYNNIDFFENIIKNFEFYKIYKYSGFDISENKFDIDQVSNYDIIVSLGNIDKISLQSVFDRTRLEDRKFFHISESYFMDDLVYSSARLGPILAFEYKPSPLDGWYRVMKRVFDLFASILFILLFGWVYILIALFIYMKDGGPVIYSSLRVGKGGRLFKMYKFRSMIKDAESKKKQLEKENRRKGPLFKIEDDPRITGWGKFLRKTSLDELPQVFNILLGDMSFVGPRPHLESEVQKYTGWQKRLLSIKPGLTGYAQIFGRSKLDFDQEAKLDLYYIQNRSLFIDIYVLFTTIRVVFKGE